MSQSTENAQRFAPLPETISSHPSRAEDEVLALWRTEKTFERLQESRRGKPAFVFWEGPPTANGRPGIHHVLARTLKDAICRFHAMQGKRVERKAGWDTHGLPVELEVEKALGISGKPEIEKYGVAAFNQKCRESVWKYREEWERLSERIGYWLDYEHPYVTYESSYVDSVWYLLARFHREGLVYRGKRVLPYCGRCGTGLSSHELAQPGVYRDVMDPSVTVRFRLKQSLLPKELQRGLPESVLAWTTTPWTLPSNFALAVHPGEDYSAFRLTRDGREEVVWIGERRSDVVLTAAKYRKVEAKFAAPGTANVLADAVGVDAHYLQTLRGAELVGAQYEPLFADRGIVVAPNSAGQTSPRHQVYAGDFVTTEDGTGIVHQAPYGVDDWELAQRNKINVLMAVGLDGRFVDGVFAPGTAGQNVAPGTSLDIANHPNAVVQAGTWFKDADKAIVADLKHRGLMFDHRSESHSYPHCWRCSNPLYYCPSPAWYIRTTALKQRMLDFNAQIRWVPDDLRKRFGEWLENNVDWNISRDRYWGTPLPFWVCEGCDAELAIGSAEELKSKAGALPANFDHHKPSVDQATIPCPKCAKSMKRTSAVLDCWFDSGAMPFAQNGWPQAKSSDAALHDQFPADYICEGLDQTRGWFYTLHVIGSFVSSLKDAKLPDRAPYSTCLVNGLVLDKDGVKMSKRLGNVVDPWKVIEEHGTDVVRWYLVASAAPWLPKKFDPAGLAETRSRFFRALINSYQFFWEYARIDAFDPSSPKIAAPPSRNEIDRWLASRTQSMLAEVRERLDACDLNAAARAIDAFVVDELSNWYIRRNRRRFWRGDGGGDKLAAFATLFEALRATSLAMAPIAPFLSEMLWRRLEPGTGSVHAQLFPAARTEWIDRDLTASMQLVERVVVMGRALREKVGIRTRQPLRALHLRSSDPESLRLLGSKFATEQVLDELNVKQWGSLAADDGKLCKLSAKANFKVLGKKIGARMKAAAASIAALDGPSLAKLRAGAALSIEVEGAPLELGSDDVLISVESNADFAVETDGRFVLWFDATLDAELVQEGIARETVSRINALRKERALAVEDRVRLTFFTNSEEVRRALGANRAAGGFRDLIASETLAESIELAAESLAGDDVARLDLGDGRSLDCRLARA